MLASLALPLGCSHVLSTPEAGLTLLAPLALPRGCQD